jgi:hypothetical protein
MHGAVNGINTKPEFTFPKINALPAIDPLLPVEEFPPSLRAAGITPVPSEPSAMRRYL